MRFGVGLCCNGDGGNALDAAAALVAKAAGAANPAALLAGSALD